MPDDLPDGYIVPDGRPITRENYPGLFEALAAMQNAPSRIVMYPPEPVGVMPIRRDVEVRMPAPPEVRFDRLYTGYERVGISLHNPVGVVRVDGVDSAPTMDMKSDDPLESL